MLQAKLTLPELQTKKVWVGLYGGHYDVIVFFKEKPTPFEDSTETEIWYEMGDNMEIAIGSMCLGQFYELYPNVDIKAYTQEDGRPLDIEIPEVFEMEITTIFDKNGFMETIQHHEDGW